MRTWFALLFVLLCGGAPDGYAQSGNASRELFRDRYNENVIFLMGGAMGGTFNQLTTDIATVLNQDGRVRVMPVIGGASIQNIKDVVLLRGIDLALITSEVMSDFRKSNELGPNIDAQVTYIAPLLPFEVHLVGRRGINSIEDLRGKKVNFNNKGSSMANFGPLLFRTLGIDVQPVFLSQTDALALMKRGDVDATISFSAKPQLGLPEIPADLGFKLLAVPFPASFQNDFLPAVFGHEDYPNLVGKDERVETFASIAVLVSFNWPKGSTRYQRTARFVDALFSRIDQLQKPPRHPGWTSVNLAATVPGMTRFAAAQEWIDKRNAQRAPDLQSPAREQAVRR